MIRWVWRKLVFVYLLLKGAWFTMASKEYRELAVEMDECPECAPIAGEFCEDHYGDLDEWYDSI